MLRISSAAPIAKQYMLNRWNFLAARLFSTIFSAPKLIAMVIATAAIISIVFIPAIDNAVCSW